MTARQHLAARARQLARLRVLPVTMAELVRFHASSKLLLLAHSEPVARELGRIVANAARLPAVEVRRRYEAGFERALAGRPEVGPVINALEHAFGHFADVLAAGEKRAFLAAVSEYRQGRASIESLQVLLRGWAARHGATWVATQSLLESYASDPDDVKATA